MGQKVTNVAIKITSVPNVGPSSQEGGTENPAAHPEDARAKVSHISPRSRSNLVTKSAYSMESASFQDHSDVLHGEKNR